MPSHDNLSVRFWAKVSKGGSTQSHMGSNCWEWTGCLSPDGYGRMLHKRRCVGAHRVSYELHSGHDPGPLFVCHHCDNRRCVRPDHMFLGTNRDNVVDMYAKGRGEAGRRKVAEKLAGERHFASKLTDAQVISARERHAAGATGKSLAEEYGINRGTMSDILARKAWRHLP